MITADPNAMRAAAASLRCEADTAANIAAQLQAQVEALQFTGPAACVFRVSMQQRYTQVVQIAGDLGELANRILVEAAQVDQQLQQAALLAQAGGTS